MSAVERITMRDEAGHTKRVLLTDVAETATFLTGIEVDQDGDRKEPSRKWLRENGGETGEIRHLIDLALVVKRERMISDWMYGHLVPYGTATQQRGES